MHLESLFPPIHFTVVTGVVTILATDDVLSDMLYVVHFLFMCKNIVALRNVLTVSVCLGKIKEIISRGIAKAGFVRSEIFPGWIFNYIHNGYVRVKMLTQVV